MRIRSAELADVREMAQTHIDSWRTAYQAYIPEQVLADLDVVSSSKRWSKRIGEAKAHTLVAEVEGKLVGLCAAGRSRDTDARQSTAEVMALYIAPSEWHMGYGRALCRQMLVLLAETGFVEVTLWVLKQNQDARRFYEKAGFAADGATRVDDRVRGLRLEEIRYRRKLA